MASIQIRGNQIKSGTIFDAQISASAAIATSKLADGANFLKKDGSVALTGNLDANSNKVVNLANPVDPQDAATKDYVDDAIAGVGTGFFKADGSVVATGDFDLGSNLITNVADPVSDQDASTKKYVDDLDAENLKRDGSVVLTGDLDANNNSIVNVATPVADTDAANKAYVDGVAQGLQIKQAVRATTTANITLSAPQTIDGVAVIAGDRVLVKDQTAAEDNGIYVVAAGAWSRSADLDEPSELTAGIFTFVSEGTLYADSGFVLVSDDPIVLGTDPQVWSEFSGAGAITAGAGLTKTGSTVDVVSANGAIVVNANDIALTLADASLSIAGGGVKIANGTAGQVVLANASGIPLAQSLTGDVASVSGTGVVTLVSTVVKEADVVTRETPSGLVNGANVTFTLANTPIAGTEAVFQNGLLCDVGGSNDYTISGSTITFVTAPESGDKVRVSYIK